MRISLLDNIRALSIICIVVCHYLIFGGVDPNLGVYLGGGGNVNFFLVSAMLYGQKWKDNGGKVFKLSSFIKKRVIRIGIPLWMYLVCILTLFIIFQVGVTIKETIANFIFLGAFQKLEGNGHLWFLTVMVMCYLNYVQLSRAELKNINLILLTILGIFLYFFLESNSMSGNFILILTITSWMFLKTEDIIDLIEKINPWLFVIIVIFVNTGVIWLLENGLFESYRIWIYPLLDICGILLFCFLYKFLPSKGGPLFSFISSISYEIYLVHHTLCAGPITRVTDWSDNRCVQFVLLMIVSISLAYVLHTLSKRILAWKFLK